MSNHPSKAMLDEPGNEISRAELVRRVVFALLSPAVRMALTFRIPLKELVDLLHMAHFQIARQRGYSMQEVAEHLGISMRKAAMLSSRLKRNFLDDQEVALPRRIEFMLWAGPLSEARIRQGLQDDERESASQAIRVLLDQGRIRERHGPRTIYYEVVSHESRLVRDTWLSRIDGLGTLLSATADTVYARFFANEQRAFARTLNLRVRNEDVAELTGLYEEHIWKTLRALDERAKGWDETVTMDFSVLWTPHGILRNAVAVHT